MDHRRPPVEIRIETYERLPPVGCGGFPVREKLNRRDRDRFIEVFFFFGGGATIEVESICLEFHPLTRLNCQPS